MEMVFENIYESMVEIKNWRKMMYSPQLYKTENIPKDAAILDLINIIIDSTPFAFMRDKTYMDIFPSRNAARIKIKLEDNHMKDIDLRSFEEICDRINSNIGNKYEVDGSTVILAVSLLTRPNYLIIWTKM
jgi:hypothetical protein